MNDSIHPWKGYDPGANWVRFEPSDLSGGAALELLAASREGQPSAIPFPRSSIVLAFKVENVSQAYERLKVRGVNFPKRTSNLPAETGILEEDST